MTKNMRSLIAGLALMPVAAAAQPPTAHTLLQGSIQALRGAGYAGLEDAQVPPAPAAAAASSTPADEPKDALTGLVGAAQAAQERSGFIVETARALGFEFDGDSFSTKSLDTQADSDVIRHFSIAAFHGETRIIVEEYSKAARELRSYRATTAGVLEAAAVTTKAGGRFHSAAIALPNSEAAAGFEAQIAFWTQNYRDHLKH